jgi:hypothetical protein
MVDDKHDYSDNVNRPVLRMPQDLIISLSYWTGNLDGTSGPNDLSPGPFAYRIYRWGLFQAGIETPC